MNIERYAPVLIPTLCRHEHLKRCLESLENCSGADKTDVYIGLDFPPSEKYVEGWKKLDAYLHEKELRHGFKSLTVHRREQNCGIGHPNDNLSQLVKFVRQFSEVYIMTEDDNEFSPNFLEYINWGLNTYNDDDSIFAICGCKNLETSDIKNNVYKLNTIFNAWGYGSWFTKRDKMTNLFNVDKLKPMLTNSKWTDAFTPKVLKLSALLVQLSKNSFYGDFIISLLPDNEKWCVFPRTNMVRNWGWDGTGSHGGSPEALKKYSTLPIDTEKHFEPVVVEDLFNPLVYKRFKEKYRTPKRDCVKAFIKFSCYKMTGFIPDFNRKGKWLKVKLQKVQ